MRKMTIAQRMMPFSHTPGARCLIPGTCSEIEAFPTLLRFHGIEVPLPFTGPVQDFTLQQDLERNCVWIFGKAHEGYFRLRLKANDAGFELFFDRAPQGKKETRTFPAEIQFSLPHAIERLSLGSHKAQDWDLMWRRFDLREILPVLYLLGQKVPVQGPCSDTPQELEAFCRTYFAKGFVPRLKDEEHQGLGLPERRGDRFLLLREAYLRIRSLFFQTRDRRVSLLPANPFHEGRLLGLSAPGIGTFDLEWSKGILRRALFRSQTSGDFVLELPKPLKTFRIRTSEQEKGRWQEESEPVSVEAGKIYLLDRFKK